MFTTKDPNVEAAVKRTFSCPVSSPETRGIVSFNFSAMYSDILPLLMGWRNSSLFIKDLHDFFLMAG
jgi:hypothetical protein